MQKHVAERHLNVLQFIYMEIRSCFPLTALLFTDKSYVCFPLTALLFTDKSYVCFPLTALLFTDKSYVCFPLTALLFTDKSYVCFPLTALLFTDKSYGCFRLCHKKKKKKKEQFYDVLLGKLEMSVLPKLKSHNIMTVMCSWQAHLIFFFYLFIFHKFIISK